MTTVIEKKREVKGMRTLYLSDEDKDKFFARYERMVLKIAHKMIKLGSRESFEDLVQNGCLGLLKAKDLYLSTGKRTQFSTYAYRWVMSLMMGKSSPNDLVLLDALPDRDDKDGSSYFETLPDPSPRIDELLCNNEVWDVVDGLPARLRLVIELRFRDGRTLQETGNEMNLTRERIRQLEAKALRLLRLRMRAVELSKAA
ncbi:MAG: hypothetical protein C0402_05310 [Thermodesulfovibrio sp.]|nr:hypothetical protein [Thermodesulfovibrio sp.]